LNVSLTDSFNFYVLFVIKMSKIDNDND
jgi:hypothetical protein